MKGRTVFYVPTKREKLKAKNAERRREYRKFMRKLASDLSKKRGLERLRRGPSETRGKLLTSSSFKNKMRTLRRESKAKVREQWRQHRRTFVGITQGGKTATEPQKQGKKWKNRKLPMFENLYAITANIRGINSCGKRQILAEKWKKENEERKKPRCLCTEQTKQSSCLKVVLLKK